MQSCLINSEASGTAVLGCLQAGCPSYIYPTALKENNTQVTKNLTHILVTACLGGNLRLMKLIRQGQTVLLYYSNTPSKTSLSEQHIVINKCAAYSVNTGVVLIPHVFPYPCCLKSTTSYPIFTLKQITAKTAY